MEKEKKGGEGGEGEEIFILKMEEAPAGERAGKHGACLIGKEGTYYRILPRGVLPWCFIYDGGNNS
jgi:hypothetical protein